MFLSSAYFDLPWLYMAIAAILGRELSSQSDVLTANGAHATRSSAMQGQNA
jgi:hypothetical protein